MSRLAYKKSEFNHISNTSNSDDNNDNNYNSSNNNSYQEWQGETIGDETSKGAAKQYGDGGGDEKLSEGVEEKWQEDWGEEGGEWWDGVGGGEKRKEMERGEQWEGEHERTAGSRKWGGGGEETSGGDGVERLSGGFGEKRQGEGNGEGKWPQEEEDQKQVKGEEGDEGERRWHGGREEDLVNDQCDADGYLDPYMYSQWGRRQREMQQALQEQRLCKNS